MPCKKCQERRKKINESAEHVRKQIRELMAKNRKQRSGDTHANH